MRPLQGQRKNTILKRRGALDFVACLSKNPYAIICRPYGTCQLRCFLPDTDKIQNLSSNSLRPLYGPSVKSVFRKELSVYHERPSVKSVKSVFEKNYPRSKKHLRSKKIKHHVSHLGVSCWPGHPSNGNQCASKLSYDFRKNRARRESSSGARRSIFRASEGTIGSDNGAAWQAARHKRRPIVS